MRTLLWLIIGSLSLPLVSDLAFSEDSIPLVDRLGLGTNSSSKTCGSSERSSSVSPTAPCTDSMGAFSLTRFNFSHKHEPFNLKGARDMASMTSQGGSDLYEASNDIPLFQEALTAEVQMMYRDSFVTENSSTPFTNRIGAQFVLKGTASSMKYLAQYGYTGQETGATPFSTPNDQVGGKLEWEWNLPLVTPKVELSRFTNNVDGDVNRAQTVANQQKFSLVLAAPNQPTLTLGYGLQQTDIFTRPDGPLSDAITSEAVSAILSFLHGAGKGDWSSYYKTSQRESGENGTEEEIGTKLSGTLNLLEPVDLIPQWGFTRRFNSRGTMANDRLFANLGSIFRISRTLTLKPGVEFARSLNRFDALQTDTISAKLGYDYLAVDDSLHVSVLGQYILNQHSNAHTNPQTYDVSLLFNKDVRDYLHLNHRQQTLSLKFAHNQEVNATTPRAQAGQTSAMLLVNFIP